MKSYSFDVPMLLHVMYLAGAVRYELMIVGNVYTIQMRPLQSPMPISLSFSWGGWGRVGMQGVHVTADSRPRFLGHGNCRRRMES